MEGKREKGKQQQPPPEQNEWDEWWNACAHVSLSSFRFPSVQIGASKGGSIPKKKPPTTALIFIGTTENYYVAIQIEANILIIQI